jgi:hypothetical protein
MVKASLREHPAPEQSHDQHGPTDIHIARALHTEGTISSVSKSSSSPAASSDRDRQETVT